jgi:hypothetical protein
VLQRFSATGQLMQSDYLDCEVNAFAMKETLFECEDGDLIYGGWQIVCRLPAM